MAIASPTSPDMPVRIDTSSSHSTLESLPLTYLPHQQGKHILHQVDQGPNPLRDRNKFMAQDGVDHYVDTMLAEKRYWSCASRQKVARSSLLTYIAKVAGKRVRRLVWCLDDCCRVYIAPPAMTSTTTRATTGRARRPGRTSRPSPRSTRRSSTTARPSNRPSQHRIPTGSGDLVLNPLPATAIPTQLRRLCFIGIPP